MKNGLMKRVLFVGVGDDVLDYRRNVYVNSLASCTQKEINVALELFESCTKAKSRLVQETEFEYLSSMAT